MRVSLGLALLCAAATSVSAQYVVSARAGTIHFTNGQVFVDDQPVDRKSTTFPTLKDGQLLHTKNGRAEILLGPGVFLRLGPHAAMRMLNGRLEDTQVEIQQGAALVEVIDIAYGASLHVNLGTARTAFRGIGLHRFDADSGDLYVYGGHAEVSVAAHLFDASRGRVVHLRDSFIESRFNPREKDDLLAWAARRSFRLFISNPAARQRLTNWEVSNPGATTSFGASVTSDQDRLIYFNPDFDVTFVSRIPGGSVLSRSSPPLSDLPHQNPDPGLRTGEPVPASSNPGPASSGPFHY